MIVSSADVRGDKNIVSIKHFAVPLPFEEEMCIAYITAKESIQNGYRYFS
jgi:hypothetical protein